MNMSEQIASKSPGLPATKRRRVVVFTNDMNAAGGIQRMAANLVRDLRPWYDTILLTVEPLRRSAFYEAGLDFRSLNYIRNPRSRSELLRDLAVVGWKLRRFVLENQIDTVVAIWYDWSSVVALSLPRSVKKIGWEHIEYGEARASWRWIRSKSYRYLDAVVSLTQEDCPAYKRISRQVHCIPNYVEGVDLTPSADRENILLTVGHLISRKGIDRLLWALKQPLQENPSWKFVVIGGGEKGHADWGYLDWVSTLMRLLQLQDRVEFYPATDKIKDWYRRASIYVMGSRSEGLPMVLIEAKAHGLPIVSFDCPTGPKEIIRPGVDGFLVDDDSYAFGESVNNLIRDAELRDRMGKAGMEDVKQRFLMAPVIQEWVNLIESLYLTEKRV